MTFLAIDPGDTTGWAKFDDKGVFIGFGKVIGHDPFLDWLENYPASHTDVWIVEAYRSRPGAINAFSKQPTIQLIGAIKRIAHKKHVRIVEQDPSPCLVIGLRFLGVYTEYYKGSKNIKHVPDNISALAHGTYYLRKEKII